MLKPIPEAASDSDSYPLIQAPSSRPIPSWNASLWQVLRYGLVGISNTLIDIASLNVLLWRFPTHHANQLLIYNSLAYTLGALNSFILNKYWTFRSSRVISGREILRFVIIMIGSFLCNEGILWITGTILHPVIASTFLWANLSKGSAAIGTASISYIAMRLWVFVAVPQKASKVPGKAAR